jgi:hypothetical protein
MKQLLEILPKILGLMPEIIKYLKYIPILMLMAGIGYGIYYAALHYKDPFVCYNNQLYKQKSWDSNVYIFIGDVCVSGNEIQNQPPVTEN